MNIVKHGWIGSKIRLKNTPYLNTRDGLRPGMEGIVKKIEQGDNPFRSQYTRLVDFADFNELVPIAEGLFELVEDVSYPSGWEYSDRTLRHFMEKDPHSAKDSKPLTKVTMDFSMASNLTEGMAILQELQEAMQEVGRLQKKLNEFQLTAEVELQ